VTDTVTLGTSSSALPAPNLSATAEGDSPDGFSSAGADSTPLPDAVTERETVLGGAFLKSMDEPLQDSTDSTAAATPPGVDSHSTSTGEASTSAGGDAPSTSAGDPATSAGGLPTSAGPSTSAGEEEVGSLYVFAPEEGELLGAAGNALAVELRPLARSRCTRGHLLSLLEGSDLLRKADAALSAQEEQLRRIAVQREGLEEVREMKEWLLLSTSLLVVVGTAVAVQIGGECRDLLCCGGFSFPPLPF